MEIAILVFFIAIFGGFLFLVGLIWFIYRRVRKSGSAGRNFSARSTNYGGVHHPQQGLIDSDDDTNAAFAGGSLFANQESENSENAVLTETAHDGPHQSHHEYSHESRGEYAAPADAGYTESSYSSYDSGASSDSGSSSSDSGSSSSSSD